MSDVYAYEISEAMDYLIRCNKVYHPRGFNADIRGKELEVAFSEFAKLVAKANQEESK